MKNKIIQWLICVLAWLTISPLFYYLSGKWKLFNNKLRIFLLLISPLFLICYTTIILCSSSSRNFNFRELEYAYKEIVCIVSFSRSKYTDKEALLRITKACFPDFKVVNYQKGEKSFQGDYTNEAVIEFETVPSDLFYREIDSLVNIPESGWGKNEQHYYYSRMWGNGLPAPEGEDDEEDMCLSISFDKGCRQATITFGTW